MLWGRPQRKTPARIGKFIAVENRKLDAIDLRILAELQANGRITNVELSRRAKITAPPCLRRMRALERPALCRAIMPISTARRWASR